MQERSEVTRGRILAAAAQHFSQSGYDATSVSGICASAGVSKGAFYHHFPSKQSVFLHLLNDWLARLDQQMNTLYHGATDVPAGLLNMASMIGEVFREASGQLPIFLEFWTQAAHDPLIWQSTIAPYQHYHLLFAAIIQQGIDRGDLKPVDPGVAARVIVGLAMGILLQGLVDPCGAAWDKVSLQGIHMLLDGIRRQARPSTW